MPLDLQLMPKKKTLIIVAGPTAVGKTKVSISLAGNFRTEIINADSRQVYREMRIGTAVPSPDQLAEVKHHLIGHRSIHEYYNASIFEFEALHVMKNLFREHDIVLMTGGSGMYIDAVCNGIDDFPATDPEVRAHLNASFQTFGLEWLKEQVQSLDPVYYLQTDINNPKRLLKALEITSMTGRPYSSFLTRQKKERDFSIILLGLMIDRDSLYENINKRVDDMINSGLIDEARDLYPHRKLNALNTVGYKEIFAHFDGQMTLEDAVDKMKQHTRNYARKQITWFRKIRNINWFHPVKTDAMMLHINQIMNTLP